MKTPKDWQEIFEDRKLYVESQLQRLISQDEIEEWITEIQTEAMAEQKERDARLAESLAEKKRDDVMGFFIAKAILEQK